MIDKIGAIILDSKRMLVARTRGLDTFFIPGGKRKQGENDMQALEREIVEELGAKTVNPKYYNTFFAKSHDDADEVRVIAYFVELDRVPKASSEIEEILWIDKHNYDNYKLGNILKIMIPEMIKEDIL